MRATFLAMALVVMLATERATQRVEVSAALAARYWMIDDDCAPGASTAAVQRCASVFVTLEDRQPELQPGARFVE